MGDAGRGSATGETVFPREVNEEAWMASRKPGTEGLWLNAQCVYTAPPGYRDVELSGRLLPTAKTAKDGQRRAGGVGSDGCARSHMCVMLEWMNGQMWCMCACQFLSCTLLACKETRKV